MTSNLVKELQYRDPREQVLEGRTLTAGNPYLTWIRTSR